MIFSEKEIILKNGEKCILRPVSKNDAKSMIEYLRMVSGETPFLLRNEDEVNYTIEDEETLLDNKRNAPREIMMVADVNGIIAGNCGIVSNGNLRRVYHRCGFAIALKQAYWNLGIGTSMIEYALALAKEMGYEQAELEVVDGNGRAKNLYEKVGFVEEGKNIRALKYDDGTYRDEYKMIKIL
ncbi:MAG: GNAT family N-acetyltransferase [Lachnospiraceae bacterium]|nr:GNAT family N-acetyltransferase [Lachnospiraceae bacterium]MDD7334151.1 GNAT family N-acetyltransferase [Lachnospiraceae bacterium]MDY3274509.1 GNAT family N-acetyltransferase [Agathobacter sp.]MDY5101715.1 GNAT family N-acetyltransferase [Agathobacter sp.]MDY5521329.1 GNAT family N-acetyltransferase [Agathobacter sp.]